MKVHDDLSKRQLSDSQNFDKAILTLSSAGLGVSITVLTHCHFTVVAPVVLIISWVSFGLAIASTLVSFLVSKCAINRQFGLAELLYLKDVKLEDLPPNRPQKWVGWLANSALVLCLVAIGFTVVFTSFNIGGESMASKGSDDSTSNARPVTTDRAGRPFTAVRPGAPETRGAGVVPFIPPNSGPAPSPAPAQSAPATAKPGPSPKSSTKP